MKEFPAKISYAILIPLLLLLVGAMLLPIFNKAPIKEILTSAAIMIPVIALTLNIFFGTSYRIIDRSELLIQCGILYKSVVDISTITSIKATRNPISSPAPSLDRIELSYGKWGTVIISPKDKVGFVKELMTINPNIQSDIA